MSQTQRSTKKQPSRRFKNIKKKEKPHEQGRPKKTVATPIAKTQTLFQSPSNSRLIAEGYIVRTLKQFYVRSKHVSRKQLTIVVCMSSVLALCVLLAWVQYRAYERTMQVVTIKRMDTEKKLIGWEQIIIRYPTYRDGYVQAAVLAYQLQDVGKAKRYLSKALQLDPNYLPSLQLEGLLLTTGNTK